MARPPARGRPVDGRGLRLAILTAEFNAPITDAMRRTALAEARRLGALVVADARAPGTFDLAAVADALLRRPDVDALVALGAVVTGETRHDEVVTFAAANALAQLAIAHRKPIGLGVTGPGQTRAQARARIDRAAWAVESVVKQFRTIQAVSKENAGGA